MPLVKCYINPFSAGFDIYQGFRTVRPHLSAPDLISFIRNAQLERMNMELMSLGHNEANILSKQADEKENIIDYIL